MFLQRLYMSRKHIDRHNKEDFASAVLAELLADRQVLELLAEELDVQVPAGPHSCQPQAAHPTGARFDIRVNLAKGSTLLVECKVDANPDLGQIQRYSALMPHATVALIAPGAAVGKLGGEEWRSVPCCSWERIAKLLAEAQFESSWTAKLAIEFISFLRHHGLGPLLPVAAEDLVAKRQSEELLADQLGAAFRSAVAMLLAKELSNRIVDDCGWNAAAMESYWWHDRVRRDFQVRGLAMRAIVLPLGVIQWRFEIRRTSNYPASGSLQEHGFVDCGDGWWQVDLFEGGPDGVLRDELRQAVEMARAKLRRIGVAAGTRQPSFDLGLTIQDLVARRRKIEEISQRVESWVAYIHGALAQELRSTFPSADLTTRKGVSMSLHGRTTRFTATLASNGAPRIGWETGSQDRNRRHVAALRHARRNGQIPLTVTVSRAEDPVVTADLDVLDHLAAVDALVRAISSCFGRIDEFTA